jgi:nucleoid-associated protein YgaU
MIVVIHDMQKPTPGLSRITYLASRIIPPFSLELDTARSYCRPMKRISFLIVALALWTAPALRAEDAATEERLNKLAGRIDDLVAGQESLRNRVQALEREIEAVREQVAKPTGNYASQEELKRLADTVKEVDQKRMKDAEQVQAQFVKLSKVVAPPSSTAKKPPTNSTSDHPIEASSTPEKGFGEYTIQKGDNLSLIIKAYADKNIKLTVDQIVKANPGLVPEKLKVGQKIWIPAPQS